MSEDIKRLSQITQQNLETNEESVAALKANAAANVVNAKSNKDQTGILKESSAQLSDINTAVTGILKKSDEDKELKVDIGGGDVWDAMWANMPDDSSTEEQRELSGTLSAIKERLGSMGKGIKSIAANTAGLLKDAIGTGFSIFGVLAAALLVFNPEKYMDLLTAGLRGLANFAQDIFSVFNPADGESRLGNIIATLKEHWGKVLSLLTIAALYLGGPLIAAVSFVGKSIGAVGKAFFAVGTFIKNVMVAQIVPMVKTGVAMLGQGLAAIGKGLLTAGKFLLANPAVLAVAAAVAAVGVGIMKFKEMWEELEGVVGGNVSFVNAIRFAVAKIMDGAENIFNLILNGINGVIRWYNDSAVAKIFGKVDEFEITAPEQTRQERLIEELQAEQTAIGANEVTPEPQSIQQQQAQFLAPQNNVIDNSTTSSSAISITQPVESKTSAFNRYNTSLLPF